MQCMVLQCSGSGKGPSLRNMGKMGIQCESAHLVRTTTIQINRTTKDTPGVELHINGNNFGPSEDVCWCDSWWVEPSDGPLPPC